MTNLDGFGSKYYPGEYKGVYGRLMVNSDTGEIEDELDREVIQNMVNLQALPEHQDELKRRIYLFIQDEVFGVDEDYSVARAISNTQTGVEVDFNHWTGPNIDATLIIDDDGTRLKGAPKPFVRGS